MATEVWSNYKCAKIKLEIYLEMLYVFKVNELLFLF